MPGDQDYESAPVLEEMPIDGAEDTDSSRTASLEENRAGFMLLDL